MVYRVIECEDGLGVGGWGIAWCGTSISRIGRCIITIRIRISICICDYFDAFLAV